LSARTLNAIVMAVAMRTFDNDLACMDSASGKLREKPGQVNVTTRLDATPGLGVQEQA
jgi:hypothetical protein